MDLAYGVLYLELTLLTFKCKCRKYIDGPILMLAKDLNFC